MVSDIMSADVGAYLTLGEWMFVAALAGSITLCVVAMIKIGRAMSGGDDELN